MDHLQVLEAAILVFLVALLYSSVGHGGASGYLAVLSLLSFSRKETSTTALILNVLVAGTAFYAFNRAGHFSFRLTWPFVLASVPMAFLGGLLPVPVPAYDTILAVALIAAAARLALPLPSDRKATDRNHLGIVPALLAGGAIGTVSGIVGIGGGIFLSPLIILMRWGDPKQAASASAGFIVVNSLAGLAGRVVHSEAVVGQMTPLVFAAVSGGMLGSRLGSRVFSGKGLRTLLATVLIMAAVKMLIR